MPLNATSITLVIPEFNAAGELDRCLDSVLCEAPDDLEVIVIDDGSTDMSVEVSHRWAAQDPRIHVLSGDNRGPSAARNRGLV